MQAMTSLERRLEGAEERERTGGQELARLETRLALSAPPHVFPHVCSHLLARPWPVCSCFLAYS